MRFIRLDISGCCCVRQAVATRIVLNKYLWSTYCIQGTALSRQPWPLPPGSSRLSREMDMTNDTHSQEQQGRGRVLVLAYASLP